MRAHAVFGPCEAVTEIEMPDPVPTGTEVVVEVSHCGLCHSDVTLWKGRFDLGDRSVPIEEMGFERPLILGHEIVGRVVALGPEAEGVAVGDRRIVFPWVGCGTCAACRSGRDNMCDASRGIGVRRPGGFGEKVVVPHPRHLVDFGDLSPALAATYACSGLTAYAAVRKLLPVDPDEAVVVIGAGGVGLSAIAILKALGHRAIVAVDLGEAKLAAARAAGASSTVQADGEDVVDRLKAAAGGPVRHVLDFVNDARTARFAFAALGKGGRLVQVGMFGGALALPLLRMPMQGLTLMGSYVGNPGELAELVALARSGRLAPIPVETVPRAGLEAQLHRLAEGRVTGRVVLVSEGA